MKSAIGFIRLTLREALGTYSLPGLLVTAVTAIAILALGLHESGIEKGDIRLFWYAMPRIEMSDLSAPQWLLIVLYRQASSWTFLIGTIAASALLINYLRPGMLEFFLSKPISRDAQWWMRVGASLASVGAVAAMFIVGIWLVFGTRLGIWSGGFLASAGLVPLIFVCTFCLSAFAAAVTRNIVFSVSVSYIFTIVSTALDQRTHGLYLVWNNSAFHRFLDALYYVFPRLDGMLDNASMLIGRAPGEQVGQIFSWEHYLYSILAAFGWYLAAFLVFRRRDA
jgi:ABC-type transport system involved in multi-copper enzyme maturation permease subunit